jgi:hypothetical protein
LAIAIAIAIANTLLCSDFFLKVYKYLIQRKNNYKIQLYN